MLRYAAQGEIALKDGITDRLSECLMCKSCEANCSSKVPVTEIIQRAREIIASQENMPFMQKIMIQNIMPNPGRLKMTNRLLRIYQNTGLRGLLRKSGMINILGPLAKAEDFIPEIAPTFRDQQMKLRNNPDVPKIRVGYFLGCISNIIGSDQAIAAVNTLREMNCHVEVTDTVCCGLPAASYGQAEMTRELAEKNIDILLKGDYDYITSDCVSCSSQLKHYEKLFPDGHSYRKKAKELTDKIVDYSELLLKINDMKKLSYKNMKVTYHIPCHMARGLNIVQEPQEVLRSIKGLEYVLLSNADTCCGAAGSYFMTHPDMSIAILRRKMENIKETGAQLVVTSCPTCVIQLQRGARMFNVPVTVKHLSEVIADASKING
jgi:glycolate oxidase iron-sulfur subunit